MPLFPAPNPTAGARTFKPDCSQRLGLSTGDVVALRIRGAFLAVTAAPQPGTGEPTYTLAPSDVVDAADTITHLEVIRQGQWVGLRSPLASDKLLQARRKGPHRLAFFSPHLGTWEQWELPEASALDSLPWSTVHVTLRNRRMPKCEMSVEMIRVGSAIMATTRTTAQTTSSQSVTPRSIMINANGTLCTVVDDPSTNENTSVRRMSGLMVNEWLAFVEREKSVRNAIEARMEQAVEDAAGLREWAAAQVQGIRKDVEEEVELLLAALSHKTAALEDAQWQLETRIRWGVALLEAKHAAVLGRRVVQAWKAVTARAKYCRTIATKLQARSDLKAKSGVLEIWAEYCAEQRKYRQKLRAAVKRMAQLKMVYFIRVWRHTVAEEKRAMEEEAALTVTACAHLAAWHQRRAFLAWRERSRRAALATRLLKNMALRADFSSMNSLFIEWRTHVYEQKMALACLEVRLSANRRRTTLETAVDAWREAVDDTFGNQMQLVHAQRVLSRRRGVGALQAWRGLVVDAHVDALKHCQSERYHRQYTLAKALVTWRQHTDEQRENRGLLVRFVHARAMRRMALALVWWRSYATWKRHEDLAVRHLVQQRALRTSTSALTAWREESAWAKVQRHRVDMCHRRHRTALLRRTIAALRQHATECFKTREAEETAEGWYAGRLQARALWGLVEAAQRRQEFVSSLSLVAAQQDRDRMRTAWDLWQQVVGQEKGLQVAVYRFQARRQWLVMKGAMRHWAHQVQESQREDTLLQRGINRINRSRLAWIISVWRRVSEEKAQERTLVAFGRHRLAKLRLKMAFSAWNGYKECALVVEEGVVERERERSRNAAVAVFRAWAAHTSLQAHHASNVRTMVDQRAFRVARSVMSAWRQRRRESAEVELRLRRGVGKLARLRLSHCIAAWRRAAEDGCGERIRMGTVGLTLAIRHQELVRRRLFVAWRGRATEVVATLAAAEAARASEAKSVLKCAFSSWKNLADGMGVARERGLKAVQTRGQQRSLALSFSAWKYQTNISTRNSIVLLHRIERTATYACRTAFDAWREEAVARRRRRVALMRFIKRISDARVQSAFSGWKAVLDEKMGQREALKRCLLQKHVAFRQFKQWYWESFDEDLQKTLKEMFEMEMHGGIDGYGGEEGVGGGSHLTSSPMVVTSLLSSPVKRGLEEARKKKEEKNRKNSSVSNPGEDDNGDDELGFVSSLAKTIRAAVAAAERSPAPPMKQSIPRAVECTGTTVLAPLVDWFGVVDRVTTAEGGDNTKEEEEEDEAEAEAVSIQQEIESMLNMHGSMEKSAASSQASTPCTAYYGNPKHQHHRQYMNEHTQEALIGAKHSVGMMPHTTLRSMDLNSLEKNSDLRVTQTMMAAAITPSPPAFSLPV